MAVNDPPRLVIWLVRGIFLSLFVVSFFGPAIGMWNNYQKMQYFKPVPVTITASLLVEYRSPRRGRSADRERIDDRITYRPLITYRYEVGGTTFESSQVWPSNNERNITEAEDMLRKYGIGSSHTGYYDPNDPDSSFLQREYNINPLCAMVLSPFLTLLPAFSIGRTRATPLDPALAARRKLRNALLMASMPLGVGLCASIGAFGSIIATNGSSTLGMRLLLLLFGLGFSAAGMLWVVTSRKEYAEATRGLAAQADSPEQPETIRLIRPTKQKPKRRRS